MKTEIINILWKFAEEKLSSKDMTHNLEHTKRVVKIATALANIEGGDLDVIIAAAILHDTGRPEENKTGISHAKISADYAKDLLSQIDFPKDKISLVCDAIRTHRFSEKLVPTTIEGKIISDADKLDAMGAIGLYRTIANNACKGRDILSVLCHLDEKLLRLKDLMYTETARKIALKRHKLLFDFACQVVNEFLEVESNPPEIILKFKRMCNEKLQS